MILNNVKLFFDVLTICLPMFKVKKRMLKTHYTYLIYIISHILVNEYLYGIRIYLL